MKVLITGTAGFIGYHLAIDLLERGDEVVGLDSINDYYDPNLKMNRLRQLGIEDADRHKTPVQSKRYSNHRFVQMDLEDQEALMDFFRREKFDRVCHLAAQAGVRYSLTHPHAYVDSNLIGFMNILEACRHHNVRHLVYASSSSVYGLNETMPFSTHDNVDHPVSLYAATKKSNELMAHTYSHLYQLPTTGLRFFTVYGPWGRPDMALFKFTKAIFEDQPIHVYNNGEMQRDFTYIDDIVEGVRRVIDRVPAGNDAWSGADPDPSSSPAPYKIYNIGNNSPVHLMDFIKAIEDQTGKQAAKEFMPMQPGDVPKTWADVSELMNDFDYKPATDIREGVGKFVEWYRAYYIEKRYSN
jgi:UDP-glucuronate 4-epimerase